MLDTTTQGARAQAGGWVCASRKSGGGGTGRKEEDHPNIIEEPNRVIEVDEKRGGKQGGKKAGKGRAAGKGDRRGEKGAGKKRRG